MLFRSPRLPPKPLASSGQPESVALIPYGCTKFRVSMFPVTERAWKGSEGQGGN